MAGKRGKSSKNDSLSEGLIPIRIQFAIQYRSKHTQMTDLTL